jgi:hypothetical protein
MKELLEKWEKFLTESGLSRLYQHMMDYDSAIISAFRNEYTNKQNYERSRELKAQLLSAGYGVPKTDGSYIENFETPEAIEISEQSLFISNRGGAANFINEIARLGEEYEQDSVLIIPEGGQDAYLLGIRQGNDFPPYGQQITVGNVKMGGEADLSRRLLLDFDEPVVETYEKLSKNSKWAVKKLVERAKKRNTKQ